MDYAAGAYIKRLPYGAIPEVMLYYSKIIFKIDFPFKISDVEMQNSGLAIMSNIHSQTSFILIQYGEDDSDKV